MLSMANANRFIRMGAIPLVIVAYAVFLWIDHNRDHDYGDIEFHIQNIKNIGRVDGLLFGGSNATYGLSAESLNYFTGVKWYNASVTEELRNIERHKSFIEDFSARIDRMKVRYVVYSSRIPYVIGMIDAFRSDNSENKNGLGIKPKKSVLQYFKNMNEIPRRNSYGDRVFDDRVVCDFSENHAPREGETKHEDIDIVVDFFVDMATFFKSVFPYASIQIIIPSEYNESFDESYRQTLRTKFYGTLPEMTNAMVKIIFEPRFSSIAQLCDTHYHANKDGRLWRTRNLVEFMHLAQR
jgi:hypothetical protein